jgi:hypothetical protein
VEVEYSLWQALEVIASVELSSMQVYLCDNKCPVQTLETYHGNLTVFYVCFDILIDIFKKYWVETCAVNSVFYTYDADTNHDHDEKKNEFYMFGGWALKKMKSLPKFLRDANYFNALCSTKDCSNQIPIVSSIL